MLLAAACSSAASTPTSPAGVNNASPHYHGPAWTNLTLTNARTGDTFKLADFAGQTVYVEPMATWCTNCRAQQHRVVDVVNKLGSEDYAFLSLQIEMNVSNADLAAYADKEGFNWTFAVVTPELLDALVKQFDRSITVPPSTPHFTINPQGDVSPLITGPETADDLIAKLTAIQKAA
jgi:thiol-disulfide isomerase/thioredoxin